MRRYSIALIFVFVVTLSSVSGIPDAFAQEGPLTPPPFEQVYQMSAVYTVPGMNKVQVRREIIYKTVDTSKGKAELKVDLYLPAGARTRHAFPAVFLISGGGIEAGAHDWRDAGVYRSYGRILAASGFAGIVFNKRYARGPEGTLNGIEDLRASSATFANMPLNSRSTRITLRSGRFRQEVSYSLQCWTKRRPIREQLSVSTASRTLTRIRGRGLRESQRRFACVLALLGPPRNRSAVRPTLFLLSS